MNAFFSQQPEKMPRSSMITIEAEYKKEIVLLLKLCWPTIVSYSINFGYAFLTLMFVGKYLTTDDFDAVVLGTLTTNLTGFSIIIGMVSSMDTLCSQAYGAKNWFHFSISVQRAIIVTSCIMVPISILWYFMGDILLFFHQPKEAALKAGIFCQLYIFMLPAYSGFEIVRRFLSCQEIVQPILIIGLIVCGVFHPLLLYLSFSLDIFHFGKNNDNSINNDGIPGMEMEKEKENGDYYYTFRSINGAAIVNMTSMYLYLICLLFYIQCRKPHKLQSWQS